MAKKTAPEKDQKLLISHIDLRQINRTTQDIVSWRNAIRSAESVLNPIRSTLYDLYFDILLDGQLESVVAKRITAITNSPLRYVKDGKDIPLITDMIETQDFTFILTEILNSVFWGYTLLELQFTDTHIVPTLIPRKHVKPEFNLVTMHPFDMTGVNYLDPYYSKSILTAGHPKNLGLFVKVAQYVLYKRGGFGDWAQFAELFGMPFRKGKYQTYDEASRAALKSALEEAGSAAYIAIPEGTDIEITWPTGTGSQDVHQKLIAECNAEISKTIVGQTMTTDNGSSRSQADVHAQVQDEIFQSDKRFVASVLNEQLRKLLALYYPGVDGGKFVFGEADYLEKNVKLDMDIKIATQVPVSDDYFYETYNIPKPENYEQLKEEKKQKETEPVYEAKKGFSNFFRSFFV